MSGLSPRAREVLDLGKDAGEPDEASLARGRAALLRRVGVSALAATAASSASSAAAATTAATTAAAKVVPLSTLVAGVATVPAAVPLVATPLLVKLTAAMVLMVGVGAGSIALRTARQPTRLTQQSLDPDEPRGVVGAAPTPPSRTGFEHMPTVSGGVDAPAPLGFPSPVAGRNQTSIEARTSTAGPVVAATRAAKARTVVEQAAPALPETSTPAPEASAMAAASLAKDVASLREAQAALVAGKPQEALAAAERVSPSGPLSDEREGIRVLAGCALGVPLAQSQAEDFVQRRPLAPLALRVRAACLAGK